MGSTEGKWRVGEPFGNGQDYPIYCDDHHEIVRVFIHNGEQEANAHLIAAAPDMYEALKGIAKTYDVAIDTDPENLEYYGEDWQAVIKALSKAEGRE